MNLTRGDRLNAVLNYRAPDGLAKSVLFVIDNFNGCKDHCWPSMATIARCACIAESTCREAIARLVAEGVLVVRKRKREDGSHTSNGYRVDYDRLIPQSGATPPESGVPPADCVAPPLRNPDPPPPQSGPLDPLRGSGQKDRIQSPLTPLAGGSQPTAGRGGGTGGNPRAPEGTIDDPRPLVQAVVAAFPPASVASSPRPVEDRLRTLVFDGRFDSLTAAGEHLLARVRAWAASRLCRTTPAGKRTCLTNWVRSDAWDVPDSEWDRDYAGPGADEAKLPPSRDPRYAAAIAHGIATAPKRRTA